MPEIIAEKYYHIYEKSEYVNIHKILEHSSSITVKAFGFGEPDDFYNHFICMTLERHIDEYYAVTNIIKSQNEITAKISVDDSIFDLVKNQQKILLAHIWITALLGFCKRGFSKRWVTKTSEIENLFNRLNEKTKHCIKQLYNTDPKMHNALRKLLVSEFALRQILLSISNDFNSNITTLEELKEYMQTDYTQAYTTVTWPLIQRFADEWDVDEALVESRLQEVLGLS